MPAMVVLFGGRSAEHEVSCLSAASVVAALPRSQFDVTTVGITREGAWVLADPADGSPEGPGVDPRPVLARADVVFPVLHGPLGEDGTVQGLLEVADVPYVGAGVMASAVCMDKAVFKDVMTAAGLPQVEYRALRRGEHGASDAAPLGLPVFVKPARLGSSVGISKVEREDQLEGALDTAWAHDPVAVVEAMSHGMEVECSVMGNGAPVASQPGQIVVNADWYDYEAKYAPGGMELVVPAPIPDETRERVRELAVAVFRRVGCAGLARADFFVEGGGRVLVNELNTMPGFTPTSVFAKLFGASGVSYPEVVDRLVSLALERFEEERAYRF